MHSLWRLDAYSLMTSNMADSNSKERYEDILKVLRDTNSTTETAQEIYKTWATNYDQDVTSHDSYNAPSIVAAELGRRLGDNKNVKILDLGAGTGLVGTELAKLGFTNIDALDPSEEMLDVAQQKGIYKTCICDYLGPQRLEIEDEVYNCLVCSGTFVPNHADESCFEELIRITKFGGLIVFMVSCTYSALLKNIDARVAELHEAGQWRVLNPGDVRENVGNKGDNSKIKGKMFVLRKN